ncbi:CUL1 [Cordylochernes scorpioides]|uniref:CUL1 n=1 Tax=Cordylochernes scorpioides TaxID=51811 RepID=A0ABY6K412_9ARAC|nr:CUL1 [Cordylochernes scorpioides]
MYSIHGTTTGTDIFKGVEMAINKKNLRWKNLKCITTDGGKNMSGKDKGVVALVSKAVENDGGSKLLVLHCFIHQQSLCGKCLDMSDVLKPVISTVNFIRSFGLNHRQFRQFIAEIGETDLPYHTAVRWLSCGKVLQRFFELRAVIEIFLNEKHRPLTELQNNAWLWKLAFYVDLTKHVNELNLRLQGENQHLPDLYTNIKSFRMKLILFQSQLRSKCFSHFKTCEIFSHTTETEFPIDFAIETLSALKINFDTRFSDFDAIANQIKIFQNPFDADIETLAPELQMEMIDLQCSDIIKNKYENSSLLEFYKSLPLTQFDNLHKFARGLFSVFGTTYLCEKTFSKMKYTKNVYRSKLTDEHLKSLLIIVLFENFVKIEGLKTLEQCGEAISKDFKLFIITFLNFRKKFCEYIKSAFNDYTGFILALDNACKSVINDNYVTKQTEDYDKPAQFLAQYCDSLLRKTLNFDSDIEYGFEDAIVLVNYLENIDAFKIFYKNMLSRRLLMNNSIDIDAEANMISNFKQFSCLRNLSSLEKMLKDIEVSKILKEDFMQYLKDSDETLKQEVEAQHQHATEEARNQEDQEVIKKKVEEYRKILVEAAIVKVMKGAKRMDAQGLTAEMIKEFSSRFKVEVGLIKTCIKDLIRKEFIEWSEEEKAINTSGGAPIVCAERDIKGFCNGNLGNQKLMKNEKALKKDSDAVKYLMNKFRKISCSKITEDIFFGPQIRKLINDEELIAILKEDEKNAWLAFIDVVKHFFGNNISPNYARIVENMISKFHKLACLMNLKLHFMDSHLNFFPDNFGAESEEQDLRPDHISYIYKLIYELNDTNCNFERESEDYGLKYLIKCLMKFIEDYLKRLFKSYDGSQCEDLLEFYRNKFEDYLISVRRLTATLSFRSIKIFIVENYLKDECYCLEDLCIFEWSEYILRPTSRILNKTILKLIEQERLGNSTDMQLVKESMDLYFENEQVYGRFFLKIYREEFECAFLNGVKEYYMKVSNTFFQTSNSITAYMIEVYKWISDECEHANRFIHHTTQDKLKSLFLQVFVQNHNKKFHSTFTQFLQENRYIDLGNIYRLVSQIPVEDQTLLVLFENLFKIEGLKTLEQCGEAISKDFKLFIITFLNFRKRFCEYIKSAFNDYTGFILALDNACKSVINDNYVTKQTEDYDKPAQFLAQYCDSLLRKTLNFDSDIEYGFEDAIVLVNYLQNIDAFKIFYKKMLSRRLLMNNSLDIDAEANMISNFKQFSCLRNLSSLEKMLKDIEVSKILKEDFMQYLKDSDETLSMDLEVTLTTSGIWPTLKTDWCNLPPEVEKSRTCFDKFYVNKHKGRLLKWNFSLSNAELITNCFRKRYTIKTSTFQMVVLLQFNNSLKLTVQQIHENTGIDMKSLYQVLQTLIKVKILETKGSPYLNTKSEVSFNTLFKNKKLKLNINMPLKKQETKEDQEVITKKVEEYRKILVEAAIVKVMKGAKRMDAQGLTAEMIKEFSSRFKVEVGLIKTCIKDLIRKEFIEWSEEEKLMKNEKALKKDSDAVKYLMNKFRKISCSKITEDIFFGPQIRKLINDEELIAILKEDEKNAWLAFIDVVKHFFGNNISPNYARIVENMISKFHKLACLMNLKLHFMDSHLNFFPDNFGAESEEQVLFENFVKIEGLKSLEQGGEVIYKDFKLFIITFLNFRKRFCECIKSAFNDYTGFILGLDNACKSVINDNYVTKQTKDYDKPAQFLAQYCDSLLRKTLNFDSDIEYDFEDAIVLVNYLENIDAFKIFYKNMLSRRLLMNNSIDIDAEANMISNFKQFSCLRNLNSLEKMLKDIEVSKILKEDFVQYLKDSDETLSMDLEVTLTTSGIWPTLKTDWCNLPPEVEKSRTCFDKFYVNKHKGRLLKWNFSLSNAELITNCFRKRYTIKTSTFQMAVLLQFNNSLKLTVQQIHENTGIDMKSLYQVLQTLIKVKILETKGSPNLNTKSEVSFNTLFKNKKLKLNINMPLKKQETKEDQEVIKKKVEEYRKILVEAAIVKVMKGAKRMDAQGLIAEMIKEFSSRFKVEVALIKTCIKDLIRKEFIEWSEEEKVYLYIP